jgi:uncharacterized metal-binding protein (TIGR02443 family)
MSAPLRRFIAGASCPLCKGLDKIYVTLEDDREVARCTACDYRSVRPSDDDPVVHPDDEEAALGVVKFTPRPE